MGYQERDAHIIDYEMYELPGVRPYPGNGRFRGPPVTAPGYIACVGAAQTFGCLCERPFPMLLAERLGVETLNLGYGGAGPTFHQSNQALLDYINRARLVIVQVMSARSVSNRLFTITHHAMEGVRMSDGKRMIAQELYADLLEHEPDMVPGIVTETRERYVAEMTRLLARIRPPKLLFWFSVRSPDYQERYELPLWKLWGAFPQLVNRAMVDALRPHAQAYVECVTSRGLPQPLHDRQGRPTTITHGYRLLDDDMRVDTHNRYYPSPEMHADAADLLAPACLALMAR